MIKNFLHAFFWIYFCVGSHVYPMDNNNKINSNDIDLQKTINDASYYYKEIKEINEQAQLEYTYKFYQKNNTPELLIEPTGTMTIRQPKVSSPSEGNWDNDARGYEKKFTPFLQKVNVDHVKIERHFTKTCLFFYQDKKLIGMHEISIPSNTSAEDLMNIKQYENPIIKQFGPSSLFSNLKTVEYHNGLYPQAHLSYDNTAKMTSTWQHKLAQVTAYSLIGMLAGGLYYMVSQCEAQKLLYK